ncbi:cation diffusion facilitator family transporter [Hirschia baltica]|uniref:Cation diffusion facilitator family transporter n=1 Tax=Hirschia baltica (strain ATCC 49814 / DSM 5838 / IFAM 1418) TaxID=582402 RepID=C6XNG5_HIRBI|nr:cation diffusion facilitator family transporter [Hirschia baltica]ACT60109.1 cation diffusion facilitator family transporter [Hirschia baltica ATCC 49814]
MAHDHMPAGRMNPPEAAEITKQTVLISVTVASILIGLKLWAWFVSGSVSVLASLADSGLDMAASLVTLGAVIYAAVPPDADHRYGHGKAEGFAALMQAGLVGASSALIAREAFDRFFDPRPMEEGVIPIVVMLISIGLTLGLIYFQTRALKKTGSIATAGDRAHYMADLGANVAVIIGVAGASFLKIPLIDPIIGLGVAIWLAFGALDVAKEAFNQLMDRELSDEARARIIELAQGDSKEWFVHDLRTRSAGPIIHIQFHLDLPNTSSLAEAHDIMVECEKRILSEFPGADILIHPDPKDAVPHGTDFFKSMRQEIAPDT